MEKIFKCFILISVLAMSALRADAVELGENSTVSILTCAPGAEVWANYGHTALRVYDPDNDLDLCFNYGLFSFDTPHFIWRFCTGETDYVVGAQDTESFLFEYERDGRKVTEQVLDLDIDARNGIWDALCVNVQPQNRTYRYNFFYDNCATRVRRMVEDHCGGAVAYGGAAPYGTLRDAVRYYTCNYPWTDFGISLLLGVPSDRPASLREQMFAPEVMMDAFKDATLDGRPIVKTASILVEGPDYEPVMDNSWTTPLRIMEIVLVLSLASTFFEWRRKRRCWAVDAVLWGVTGLAGVVIGFIALISSHPATDPNYLLIWLDPLALVYAIALCFRRFRNSRAAVFVQTVFLPFVLFGLAGFFFLPQFFPLALMPFNLSLLCRCGLSVVNGLNRSRNGKHLK